MMDPDNSSRERLYDLLVDRTLDKIDEREHRELEALISRFPDEDVESFEFAAAAIDLAYTVDRLEPLPTDVRTRVESRVLESLRGSADVEVGIAPATPPERVSGRTDTRRDPAATPTPARPFDRLGWLAAAACLVLAIGGWWPRLQPANAPSDGDSKTMLSVSDRRASLESSAQDLVRGDWQVQPVLGDTVVEGDFVWSEERQEGYMRFEGLPVNDPTKEQYQLWLIVPSQEQPIDGGVFDARADGTFEIDINAKLGVENLSAAAITIEKPGGVVVSKQEKLILLAQPESI